MSKKKIVIEPDPILRKNSQPIEKVDDVLKIALIKELKRVEWVEVDSLSKSKDKSEKVLTN